MASSLMRRGGVFNSAAICLENKSQSSRISSGAIAQRNEVNGNHGQAVEEILAEQSLFYTLFEDAVSCHQHANVDLAGPG